MMFHSRSSIVVLLVGLPVLLACSAGHVYRMAGGRKTTQGIKDRVHMVDAIKAAPTERAARARIVDANRSDWQSNAIHMSVHPKRSMTTSFGSTMCSPAIVPAMRMLIRNDGSARCRLWRAPVTTNRWFVASRNVGTSWWKCVGAWTTTGSVHEDMDGR